jgi:hypothetical protein
LWCSDFIFIGVLGDSSLFLFFFNDGGGLLSWLFFSGLYDGFWRFRFNWFFDWLLFNDLLWLFNHFFFFDNWLFFLLGGLWSLDDVWVG